MRNMTTQDLLQKIDELPEPAKKEAEDFVDFLYERYAEPRNEENKTDRLTSSAFFGIWEGREEMADSTAWVKEQRRKQWRSP